MAVDGSLMGDQFFEFLQRIWAKRSRQGLKDYNLSFISKHISTLHQFDRSRFTCGCFSISLLDDGKLKFDFLFVDAKRCWCFLLSSFPDPTA